MQLVGAVIEEKLNENDSIIFENINSNYDNNNKNNTDSNILKVEDVSSDNESLVENTVIHHVNNNHYEYSPKERPLSKDDMLLLPPLPQSLLLPSRQSSITSVPEIESLNILKEEEEQPLSDLDKRDKNNSKHDRTIYDLSKALEISDTSYLDMTTSSSVISLSRVHSRNISSVSSTSIPKINTGNRNNNVILSSPTTLPSFSFTQNSSTNSLFDAAHTNTNTVPSNNSSFPSKRFFSMSLSRQNSTSAEGTSTAQTIKSRSRSLSNSNIFRKLNISNPNSLSTSTTTTTNKTAVPKIKTRHCSMSSPKSKKKTNCLIIGDITTVKELMTFEKIDFHNNDNEQNKYIHKLIDLQKQDDNKFEIILNKISKDLWYSNKEINDLKLQRIQLNDLWAKKINHYQNI
ncbi:hypothetical protein C6P45_003186 [Maudiozyma exigua]|uniref:Uncharacterized protein n=1 Tax=Maudiozyma exigua TaxID=34358 RepID=A0A9P6WC18_MAUEX|nr:hypothetical protein C6P45_003186 [Kazachstania exigua]